MLTLILALVAGACLAAGWLLDEIDPVYAALAASGGGLVLMAVQAWSRRRSAARDSPVDDEEETPEPAAEDDEDRTPDDAAPDEPEVPDPDEAAEPLAARSSGERLADDAVVHVLSGRRRFHLPGCRLLDGRDVEELTLIDAREEAFTPCTICVMTETKELLAERG